MTRRFLHLLAAGAIGLAVAAPSAADPASFRQRLTLAGAKSVAAAAVAEAKRLDAGGAIAVVDDGGSLLYLERLDDTFPAAAAVAIEKARTAATFRKATRDFENAIAKGRTALVAVDAMTPLQGGVPIAVGGVVVGAVGVSGAMSAQQDDDIATVAAAAAAAAPMPAAVASIPGAEVAAAFVKGRPLIETDAYKIHASRRDAPGQAEVHDLDTDILYVLDGSATLVTGGEAVAATETAPRERRGASIAGGVPRRLAKGDVVIIPNGVPHQFTAVQGPFLYYTVKVTAGGRR